MPESRRHRLIWIAVGCAHLVAFGAVWLGGSPGLSEPVREGGLVVVSLLPEPIALPGEAKGGGAQRPSILADVMEALIGAIYVDSGYAAALELVRRLLAEVIGGGGAENWGKDAKTALQEWLQARRLAVPGYRIAETRGQAHAQTFEVECSVPALSLAKRGEGRSRRVAEQDAARRMLDELISRDKPGSGLRD